MNDQGNSKTNPVKFILCCIIFAVLGVAPFIIGNIFEWDTVLSVVIMIVVSAPLSTAIFNRICRKN